MAALLAVDIDQWRVEMDAIGEYLDSYGERLPKELREQHAAVSENLRKAG